MNKKKTWQKRQKNDRNPHIFCFFNKNIFNTKLFYHKGILKNSNRLSLYWYLRVIFTFFWLFGFCSMLLFESTLFRTRAQNSHFRQWYNCWIFLPFILLEFFSFFSSSFSSFQRLIHAVAYSAFYSFQSLICVVAYLTFLW